MSSQPPALLNVAARILIVDDSPSDRTIFRRLLLRGTTRQYLVEEASTASEAVALLNATLPDCVLVDFHLPETDGLNFVRQLVSNHGEHAFGIVMLTSTSETAVAVKAMQWGAHDYLEKNQADAASLQRAVENAIEKAAIQRELESKRRALAQKNSELERHVSRLEQEAADRIRAEEALRLSESQLRLVTDHAFVLLAQVDRNHRYKYANRAYAERHGKEVSEIIGAHIADVVGESAYLAALQEINAALSGKRVEFEKEIPYGHLGVRWLHVVFMPEVDASGQVHGFVAVITDLTERKLAEQALKQARDHAIAASGAKDEFLARLSHELRTPLSPVLLLASEAAANPDLPAEVRADFHAIRKSVDLEARLIDDLLDLTRISRGKLSLERRRINLHTVLEDALFSVRPEGEKKGISIQTKFGSDSLHVWGDAVRLQQIFWNLLNNAVKFTPSGGWIKVHTGSEEDRAIVTVEDNGIGLSAMELENIFEAFTQGEHALPQSSSHFGGLGLGLAISRMLVELHGGQVEAFSPGRNQGAVLRVWLPRHDARDSLSPQHGPDGSLNESGGARQPGSNRGLRILVVEDHEATRQALHLLLERRGHLVTTAGTTAEAKQQVEIKSFDLMISDIGLPDGSGYDLVEALRASHGIPAVALSGYGMEQDVARSTKAGFFAHLTKPVRIQDVDAVIEKFSASAH